jgi:hypothetical protein
MILLVIAALSLLAALPLWIRCGFCDEYLGVRLEKSRGAD